MRIGKSSIFRSLLLSIVGTGLLVALVSGLAHYLLATRLIEDSVTKQMETALQASISYFEKTYVVPVSGDLRLLEASPVVDKLLMSFGSDAYLNRPSAERLFLNVEKSHPTMYSSVRLVDASGHELLIIEDGKRVRHYESIVQTIRGSLFEGRMTTLFERLRTTEPGTVLFEGPIEKTDSNFSFLAGISKREPEIGGFGGAVIAHIDLADYLKYLASFEIFGQPMTWVFDNKGKALLQPPSHAASLNPTSHLFHKEPLPKGGLVRASGTHTDSGLLNLFCIALSMSPEMFSAQLHGTGLITLLVLIAIVLFASIIAFLLARQLASPIRALSRMTAAVAQGNLETQASENWRGELGQLGTAFNHMVDALRDTTFSKDYVDNIIQSMTDTLVVVDRKGMIDRANRALLDLLGYRDHELLGVPFNKILNDNSVELKIEDALQQSGSISGMETSYLAKGGNKIPVLLSSSTMGDHNGRVVGFVCVAHDITERKKAEAEIERARQHNEQILNSAGEGIYGLDLEGNTTFANPAAAKMLGWEAKNLIGKPQHKLVHHSRPDGSSYPRNECPIYAAFKDGTVHHVDDEVFWRKDGTAFPVEYISNPIRSGGKLVGAVVSFRDITERKQAEKALRRYERIVSASSDFMAFIDSNYVYQAANKVYLEAFDKTEQQIIGNKVAEVLGEEEFETQVKPHLDHCLEGKTSHYQRWYELPSLGLRYLDARYDPFYDPDGTVSGIAVNIRDATETKQAENEREALYRQLVDTSRQAGKAEIATGVLHNVGNVLNSVNVSATLVADKFRESKIASLTRVGEILQDHSHNLATFLTENEKGKQLPVYLSTLADHLQSEHAEIISEIESIVENVDHIKQIVVRQQSYASDSGVSQPTVIADLLDDALSMNVSERHAIDIVREYPDISAAMLDKHKVLQIIVNLIRNAKQAVNEREGDDKKITLRIRYPGSDYVYIEVSDNGPGIPSENMSRIFEYGFTTKEEGHGFGLHVSANTAREIGGSLTCGSEGTGKGATFILELPFTPAEMVA